MPPCGQNASAHQQHAACTSSQKEGQFSSSSLQGQQSCCCGPAGGQPINENPKAVYMPRLLRQLRQHTASKASVGAVQLRTMLEQLGGTICWSTTKQEIKATHLQSAVACVHLLFKKQPLTIDTTTPPTQASNNLLCSKHWQGPAVA